MVEDKKHKTLNVFNLWSNSPRHMYLSQKNPHTTFGQYKNSSYNSNMMASKLCMSVDLKIKCFFFLLALKKSSNVGYFVNFGRVKKECWLFAIQLFWFDFHFSADYIHSWDAPDWWKPATHKHFFFKTKLYITSELNFAKKINTFFD